ncbi:UspA domain protein [Candidatus Vecturithrix granuli]|uniref:UspA domain protein n=1 Tax=Vecturithrix granuli TaxID=1499967 RepID=A0A081BWX2_VECG1|nr:UspA domain protein [Candidatus Vecturithrix granuli]
MYPKILVPVKLTLAFDSFMEYLSSVEELGIQEVHLVNVLQVKDPVDAEILASLESEAFEREKKIWAEKGIRVVTHAPFGRFHEEINRIADKEGIDVIVTCSLAESLIYELILDPMADNLVRNARHPVLTLSCHLGGERKEVQYPIRGANLFKKILFPTDFSDNAEHALDTVVKTIVKKTGAGVRLLHVQEHKRIHPHLTDRLAEFNQIDTERLERIKTELLADGASEVTYTIVEGHAALVILDEIARTQPTLVVMGNQGRGRIHELFIGSVAHHVVRQAPAPVLLIPWREK